MPPVSKSVDRKHFASAYFAVSFSPEIMPLLSKTAVNSIHTVYNYDIQNYCKPHSTAPPGEHLYEIVLHGHDESVLPEIVNFSTQYFILLLCCFTSIINIKGHVETVN